MKYYENNTKIEIRSNTVMGMIEYLLDGKEHTASELSTYVGLDSSAGVFPRLIKHTNIINIRQTQERFNLYSIKTSFIKHLKWVAENFRVTAVSTARAIAKRLARYELDEIDKKVILYIVRYIRTTKKKWIDATSDEMSVADMIAKAIGLKPSEVIESLKTLMQMGILGKYRRKLSLSEPIIKAILK